MFDANDILNILKLNMVDIEKHHVTKIALFGSYARNEQNSKSDIDILVEFETGQETFDNYMDLKFCLEELFGLKVDLVIFDSVKPSMKSNIMENIIYAKGA